MANLSPVIAAGVAAAIAAAGSNPNVPITPAQAAVVAPAVVDALKADPVVVNATNGEPWYQSRVTWGAVVAIAAPIAGLLLKQTVDADTQAQLVTLLTAAGGVVGGAITLWGRWSNGKAPLGSKV